MSGMDVDPAEAEHYAAAEGRLASEDPDVREKAAIELLGMSHPLGLDTVLERMRSDPDPAVRADMIRAAAFSVDHRCFQAVLGAVKDTDDVVRKTAASALSRFSRPDEIEAMTPAGSAPGTGSVEPSVYRTDPGLTRGAASGELLQVRIRYKAPDGDTSKLLVFPVRDEGGTFARASDDFQFAAAVASFGMLLRDSEHKGNATFDSVVELAEDGRGADAHGYRGEFIALVAQAKTLVLAVQGE